MIDEDSDEVEPPNENIRSCFVGELLFSSLLRRCSKCGAPLKQTRPDRKLHLRKTSKAGHDQELCPPCLLGAVNELRSILNRSLGGEGSSKQDKTAVSSASEDLLKAVDSDEYEGYAAAKGYLQLKEVDSSNEIETYTAIKGRLRHCRDYSDMENEQTFNTSGTDDADDAEDDANPSTAQHSRNPDQESTACQDQSTVQKGIITGSPHFKQFLYKYHSQCSSLDQVSDDSLDP